MTRMIRVIAVIAPMALTGCAGGAAVSLGAPPTIYRDAGSYPATMVAPEQRSDRPQLFYVTDREPEAAPGGGLRYGYQRSASMAFGVSEVVFGRDLGWGGLVRASNQAEARGSLSLRVLGAREIVRFRPTPLPFEVKGGRPQVLQQPANENQAQTRALQAAIAAELRRSTRKEVVIFIHGFRTDFEDAQASLAGLWHYSGRIGVPILYSWPAGNPGVFGYFKDRESGEFSIFHLKEFLTMLAQIPELDHINIIAHSRGSDVATSALREMMIAARAAGQSPQQVMKVKNLILAAPDLDFGVVQQRLVAEHFGASFGQITVYLNPQDSTLGLAQKLMAGIRLGRISFADLSVSERESFRRIRNVNFVNVESVSRARDHSYFRDNPSVLSDIVLTLRTDALPGSAVRPMQQNDYNFWSIHKGYPFERPAPPAFGTQRANNDRN